MPMVCVLCVFQPITTYINIYIYLIVQRSTAQPFMLGMRENNGIVKHIYIYVPGPSMYFIALCLYYCSYDYKYVIWIVRRYCLRITIQNSVERQLLGNISCASFECLSSFTSKRRVEHIFLHFFFFFFYFSATSFRSNAYYVFMYEVIDVCTELLSTLLFRAKWIIRRQMADSYRSRFYDATKENSANLLLISDIFANRFCWLTMRVRCVE